MNVAAKLLTKLGGTWLKVGDRGGMAENRRLRTKKLPPAAAESGDGETESTLSASTANNGGWGTPSSKELSAIPPNPPLTTSFVEPNIPLEGDHFLSLGLEALPDDLRFLQQFLPKASKPRNKIIREYIGRWHQALKQESVGHRKQNAGRRAANLWVMSLTIHAERIDWCQPHLADLPNDFGKKER